MTYVRPLVQALVVALALTHCGVNMARKDGVVQGGGSGTGNNGSSNNGGNNGSGIACKLVVEPRTINGVPSLYASTPDVTLTGSLRQYANDPNENSICAYVTRTTSTITGQVVYYVLLQAIPSTKQILTIGFIGDPTVGSSYSLAGFADLLSVGQPNFTALVQPVNDQDQGTDLSLFAAGSIRFDEKPSATGGHMDLNLTASVRERESLLSGATSNTPGTLSLRVKF